MKQIDLRKIIQEEIQSVLKESLLNPKAFTKLFIQNVKNGLVEKPITYKDLKLALDYVTRLSGIPDLKKTHKKEYEEIMGHLVAFYNLEK